MASNAYASNVPTSTDSRSHFDSQINAQRKSRSVLSQRGILRPDQSEQSESSEDEEESDGLSSVGGTLPPTLRHEFRSDSNCNLPSPLKLRKTKHLSTVDETQERSAISRSLVPQGQNPCHERRSSNPHTSAGARKHPIPPSRSRDRRYVSFSEYPSRDKRSKFQQQLGNLRNASYQSLISSLTSSSGSSGSSTATQRSYNKLTSGAAAGRPSGDRTGRTSQTFL
jgi:hypothetical protein